MIQTISQTESTGTRLRPLCVDLDGTLVKSDTLVDSLLVLLRTHPALTLVLPARLLSGKVAFKEFVTKSISLDVTHLPYNRKLLPFLQQQHAEGRAIYLATGADVALANRIATHLGIFSGVLGSDGTTNLTGNRKLDGLRTRLGIGEFDYIGNATPDLPLLANATRAMVANPSLALRIRLRARGIRPVREFQERSSTVKSVFRAMRPHQWAKNLLIVLPLLLAHKVKIDGLGSALLAFCCFSITASATYIVNDLLDIETDRHHPQKRLRPFASGDLSAFTGAGIAAGLLLLALLGARLLPVTFYGWLLLYLGMTLAYSTYLKKIPVVDVLTLSGLYTLRLLAGSAATNSHISHWLGGFSVFLFFSLAVAKRFAELKNMSASDSPPKNGRGYMLVDIPQLRSFGTSSAFAAVVIFANYIGGLDVSKLYRNPTLLWMILPLMILWLCRIWLLATRGELHEDPVVFALTDRMSLLIGVAVGVVAILAI
ncbi:MAG TPA: UbiA family prenyltransferase [Terracidiphilus sp.]|nr:UbiA family prenyltransferase [Terracidiphilus sp.]